MCKLKIITRLVALAFLLTPHWVLGDGGYLSAPEREIYEPAQQAFIDYDADAGTEQLSILPSFYGNAGSFAWIVPVPNLPEVELADRFLFSELDNLTRPVHHRRDGDWGCFSNQPDYATGVPDEPDVEVIASELVGYYQTMIVAATDAPALLDSLTDWGFLHAQNRDAFADVVTNYVDRGWYFVTFRVDSAAIAEVYPWWYPNHYINGGLNPVRLTFAAQEMVYPMLISAISATDESRVRLYVKADHRMTFPGAATHYANRFTSGELAELPFASGLENVFAPGDFLTELYRVYSPHEMTADITLQRASNDDEFLQVIYSGLPWTGLVILLPALGMAIKRRFWLARC